MCISGRSMHGSCKLVVWKTADNFSAFQILKGPTQKVVLRTQSKNTRNFHFVTTRHLKEGPVLRSHKFNRFEQRKIVEPCYQNENGHADQQK